MEDLSTLYNSVGSYALTIGGVDVYVRLLCRLFRTIAMSDLVREIKRAKSKWIKAERPALVDFHWHQGSGAFSISPAHVIAHLAYIAKQEVTVHPIFREFGAAD